MRRFVFRRVIFGIALALVAAVVPAEAGARGQSEFTYTTPHYIVTTDISPRFTEIVGRHMEEIYKEYSRRFADFGQAEGRFRVRVFRREQDYWQHIPAGARGATGVFVERERLLAAHAQDRTGEEVLRTLYHEGLHQFVYQLVSRDCPVWLNEGLAEYFAEATWDGRGFSLGLVPTTRLRVLKSAIEEGTYLPFRELFEMDGDMWIQNARTDALAARLNYSQAWSIIHFLIHADEGAHAPRLNRLLRAIADDVGQDEALRQAFGPDLNLQAFERAWAGYVMSLEPSPKFRCREGMEAIMLLAMNYYEDVREFRSVARLRRALMQGRRTRWEIRRPGGERISSRDPEQVARLFRCPLDGGGHEVSHVVVSDPGNGLPILVCTHHPGIVVKAYYERSRDGLRVRVEEEVRDLMSPEFRNALGAAMR